ncbi:Uncharacterised protein [Vibrio cholerae]|nr:Uncharacterised protein [Vibrio cholerae]
MAKTIIGTGASRITSGKLNQRSATAEFTHGLTKLTDSTPNAASHPALRDQRAARTCSSPSVLSTNQAPPIYT